MQLIDRERLATRSNPSNGSPKWPLAKRKSDAAIAPIRSHARRRAIRRRYVEALAELPGLRFLGDPDQTIQQDNCWLTTLELDPELAPLNAEELIGALGAEDIEARHIWKPMHLQPVFAAERSFLTGQAERLFANGVTLPSGSSMKDDDVERVVEAVRKAMISR